MKMYEKKNFPRTSHDFVKMYKDGKLTFDNAVQRSLTWDNDKKSLLIHTMIIDFPIPPMYCNCIFEDPKRKVYDFVDGKQRILGTIIPFLNDEFALTNVPIVNMDEYSDSDEDAEEDKLIDINGMKYSELPEELRDKVRNYSLVVYFYENMDQEDVENLFFRLNNGKSLTAIELTRVKARSLETIQNVAEHEIFNKALTEKAKAKYTNEDLVIKSWAILYTENPSFETKHIRPTMENADITEEQANTITAVYNRLLEVYKVLASTEDKQDKKVAKRIITRTHMVSLVPIIAKLINNEDWNTEHFINWVRHFFSGKRSATNNDLYNNAARSGSGKSENVKRRIEVINDDFKEFVLTSKVSNNNQDTQQQESEEDC